MTCLPEVNVWFVPIVAETSAIELPLSAGLRQVTGKRFVDAGGAWEILDRVRQSPNIAFAREPAGIEGLWRGLTASRSVGYNFRADAYLAAFAEASGFTLVTFDRGFRQYKNTPVKILSSPS